MRRFLTSPSGLDPEALAAENEDLKRQIEQLQLDNSNLRQQLQQQEQADGA